MFQSVFVYARKKKPRNSFGVKVLQGFRLLGRGYFQTNTIYEESASNQYHPSIRVKRMTQDLKVCFELFKCYDIIDVYSSFTVMCNTRKKFYTCRNAVAEASPVDVNDCYDSARYLDQMTADYFCSTYSYVTGTRLYHEFLTCPYTYKPILVLGDYSPRIALGEASAVLASQLLKTLHRNRAKNF